MNLENYFYVFPEVVPSRLCDDLIHYGEQKTKKIALTGENAQQPKTDQDFAELYKTRNSSVCWLDDPWIYNTILPFVREANFHSGWNFDWSDSETCQWTKYSETQHYTWHQDSFKTPRNGLIRKLSVTVSLADGDTYEGGDLEFDLRNTTDSTPNVITSQEARKKGSVIVFPSFIWHRVSPVIKGTRYSLVIWNLGKPFL
jgi:PKHD-type hydroxylase